MSPIIIDATSGEGGGREAVEGAALASLNLDVELVVVGPAAVLAAWLRELAHDAERIRVLDAAPAVDLAPNGGVAGRPGAAAAALEYMRHDAESSFITAGPPAPVLCAAHDRLSCLPGVARPALAAVYPTLRHRGERADPFALLLDVGASMEAFAEDLVRFAQMGAAYSRLISQHERPRVAMLVPGGTERALGDELGATHARLVAAAGTGFEYIGCLGADRLTHGDADVIVTNGGTGDVAIRTLEGVAETGIQLLERAASRFRFRMGVSLLGSSVDRLREISDWESYGGSPLLGFDRTIIFTHPRSRHRSFVNAVRLARKIGRVGALGAMVEAVRQSAAAVE